MGFSEKTAKTAKTAPKRFWALMKEESGSLLLVNVVFLALCVPLVTLPPAILALHKTMLRMMEGKPAGIKDFLSAFGGSWARGWGAFALTALPLAASGYGMSFYLRFAASNIVFFIPFVFCSTVFLVTLLASVYLYRLLAGGKRLGEAVKQALPLGMGRPARAVMAAAWYYVPLIAAILWFPLSGLYLMLMGFTLPCLLGNLVLEKIIPTEIIEQD